MVHEDKPTEGILVVDKPAGRSSMSIVAEMRRRAGGVRTGHAGTLDPLATGVLLLAMGQATRSIEMFMQTRKGYRTEIALDAFTVTDDEEGEREVVDVPPERRPDRAAIDAVLASSLGVMLQTPPAYSAMKIGGRRAYRLAREGKAVALMPRPVEVDAISLVRFEWPLLTIDMTCGKGFYVRSFARDLGGRLGTGGYCRSIRRTRVGPFTIDDARRPEDFPDRITADVCIPTAHALARIAGA